MTEELYIDGSMVDLEPDAASTLNFKSNLFGDISKITASNSQTIRCPKTSRNRKTFDNPGAVAYLSGKRYSRYSAHLVRNGVEIVNVGYAVLLSASAVYEIALYWGVMANFQAWVDEAPKLNDLPGTESLAWNKSTAPTDLATLKSRGYGYAAYDCGVSNVDLINIHPSATAWWILGKIAAQAGFRFEMPSKYEERLRTMAIPCLGKNASPESWDMGALKGTATATLRTVKAAYKYDYYWEISLRSKTQDVANFQAGTIEYWPGQYGEIGLRPTLFSTRGMRKMRIKIHVGDLFGGGLKEAIDKGAKLYMAVKSGDHSYDSTNYTIALSWSADIAIFNVDEIVDCSGFDWFYFGITGTYGYSTDKNQWSYDGDIQIFPQDEEMRYPSGIGIARNLPEITQIDFIKAICGMLGIFAVPDPSDTNMLKFVSVDVLQANKGIAHDWSDKLVASNEDEPKMVEFKIGDYARDNLFKYKEDDTVETNADGNLQIASELLEKEKTVITLPFAASDGSEIPHYRLSDDGTKAEDVRIKERIMGLMDNGSGRAALTFDGMGFPDLLSKYYSTLSDLLNSAIMISEQIMLNEIDLKSLDYTVPFYLRQYGKYYGIISIQSTADKPCEVKAVQLPETAPTESKS